MGKIGTTELLIVLAIVLVIFGPKALPKLGRSMGKTIGGFRKGLKEDVDDDEEEVVVAKKSKASKEEEA
ncbi:MAG: twin-arginine translocase TatA/TatE family subunit [Clostridia bacterium]|nr:twin-arginine translocase TatA/TatE family subunit [Clostridia bacterium]